MRPSLAAAVLAALAAAGCVSTPEEPGSTSYLVAEGYAARRPADVAVLPVEGALPANAADAVREALRAAALARRYAPVRSREVDSRRAEFAPGGPNAVLVVRVTEWDDGRLFGDGTVRASAEARLTGPGSSESLYFGSVTGVRVRARSVPVNAAEKDEAVRACAAALADLLLDRLPVKGDG